MELLYSRKGAKAQRFQFKAVLSAFAPLRAFGLAYSMRGPQSI